MPADSVGILHFMAMASQSGASPNQERVMEQSSANPSRLPGAPNDKSSSLVHCSLFTVHCSLFTESVHCPLSSSDLTHIGARNPPELGSNRLKPKELTVFYFARESAFCTPSAANITAPGRHSDRRDRSGRGGTALESGDRRTRRCGNPWLRRPG